MNAIVFDRYGPPEVLRIEAVQKPAPEEGQALVRVVAAAVGAGDWHLVRGEPFLIRLMAGLMKPRFRIPGSDVAGRVEAVGAGVVRIKPGDEVFGDLSSSGFGGFAEYVCAKEDAWALKPPNLSFEEAAATPGSALAALQAIRKHGRIGAGQKVLVTGASGGVGSFAVQMAANAGAEVTAVARPDKIDFIHSLGAHHVIDRTRADVTRGTANFDLILDAAAYRPIREYRPLLTPQGAYVLIGGAFATFLQALLLGPFLSRKGGRTMTTLLAAPNPEDLETIRGLLATAHLRPMIDRVFPLSETASALRHVEGGHARGKVVLRVAEDG